MRNTSLFDAVTSLDDPASRGFLPCNKIAGGNTRRAFAENDATCDDLRPATVQRALHDRAANSDGIAKSEHDDSWPMMDVVYHAAGARRAAALHAIAAAAFRGVRELLRRAYSRHRRRRLARSTRDALNQLDDRALHDLGFQREEIESVAAEVAGHVDRTRERVLRSSFGHLH